MTNRPSLPLGDYYQLLLRRGLLADKAPLAADLTTPVALVSCDSNLVIPRTLFVCKGAKFKEDYLRQAMEKGAFAYVSQVSYPAVPLPCLRVSDIRQAMGLLADKAYGHPSGKLKITGITGTKGKTTTAYYVKSILDAWLEGQGHRESALLSTIVTDDGVERRPAKLTTPEPLDLQRHLSNAVGAGADYLTMEVSSQALKYGRVIGVDLSCAVFLNIGEDHISPVEHPDLEDYLQSKLLIFKQAKTACISLDCDHAPEVAAAAARCEKVITFSQKDPAAAVYGSNVRTQGGEQDRLPRPHPPVRGGAGHLHPRPVQRGERPGRRGGGRGLWHPPGDGEGRSGEGLRPRTYGALCQRRQPDLRHCGLFPQRHEFAERPAVRPGGVP